jgi:hypothetical protein
LKDRNSIPLSVSDIAGSSIEKARKYLAKLAGLPMVDDEWQILVEVQLLRNIIVHRGGEQGGDKNEQKTLAGLLSKYGGKLSLSGPAESDNSTIEVSFDLCSYFVDKVRAFFQRIFEVAGLSIQA